MDTHFPSEKMTDFLLTLIRRKVLYKKHSPFNGELVVIEDIFGKRLLAGGLSQSGPYIQKLWNFAVLKVRFEPKTVLVLGLGAGSCLVAIQKKWPHAKITAVEIDPKMTEIGKEFFGLSAKDLHIHIQDAFDFVKKTGDKFDLVIIDLFSSDRFPKEAENNEFILYLKKKMSDKGYLIFNRLYFGKHRNPAQKYKKTLEKFFTTSSHVYPLFLPSNMLIFCKNQ